jgi:hypothetical protein
MPQLHASIPGNVLLQKYHTNICPIINGYEATDILIQDDINVA